MHKVAQHFSLQLLVNQRSLGNSTEVFSNQVSALLSHEQSLSIQHYTLLGNVAGFSKQVSCLLFCLVNLGIRQQLVSHKVGALLPHQQRLRVKLSPFLRDVHQLGFSDANFGNGNQNLLLLDADFFISNRNLLQHVFLLSIDQKTLLRNVQRLSRQLSYLGIREQLLSAQVQRLRIQHSPFLGNVDQLGLSDAYFSSSHQNLLSLNGNLSISDADLLLSHQNLSIKQFALLRDVQPFGSQVQLLLSDQLSLSQDLGDLSRNLGLAGFQHRQLNGCFINLYLSQCQLLLKQADFQAGLLLLQQERQACLHCQIKRAQVNRRVLRSTDRSRLELRIQVALHRPHQNVKDALPVCIGSRQIRGVNRSHGPPGSRYKD